jgi:hypothetical protein
MTSRLKIFGLIAVLGFVAGIIAQVTAAIIIPAIVAALPSLSFISSYLIAGFAGAVLTVVLVSAWAYMSGNKDRF